MNKKATTRCPAYCRVQGKATGKAKEEKETGPHFVGQAGPYTKAISRVPTTASHLHDVLIQAIINQGDSGAGCLDWNPGTYITLSSFLSYPLLASSSHM